MEQAPVAHDALRHDLVAGDGPRLGKGFAEGPFVDAKGGRILRGHGHSPLLTDLGGRAVVLPAVKGSIIKLAVHKKVYQV